MALFAAIAHAQSPDVQQDYSRITQVPRADVDAWLKQEVKESGGDWDKDRYHLFIGFSTGHFGQDPVNAIGMRRLAFSIVNNSLAVGDQVTPIAYEMTTWNVGPTVTLSDDPATRAEFANQVPYAPKSESHGGHDMERVLYETVTKAIPANEAGSSIVLLLTNSNASQGPSGEKATLFGANNPQLADAINKGGFRLPLVRKEFRLQAGSQPVTVAVTALFPKKLVGLPDAASEPRYPTFSRDTWQPSADKPAASEVLPNPSKTEQKIPGTHPGGQEVLQTTQSIKGSISPWVWAIVALVVIAGLFLIFRPKPQPAKVTVKPEAPAAAAALGRPIPGSLTVQIGTGEQTLQPLMTGSRWILQRDEAGNVTLVDAAAPPKPEPGSGAGQTGPTGPTSPTSTAPATPIAQLAFDAERNLRVTADSGAQFVEFNGPDPTKLDSQSLTIAPGKRAFCRIVPAGSTTRTRLEVAYNTTQKGIRT